MKSILFIGHEFHQKTKSFNFILDLLSTKYSVDKFFIDPDNDNSFEELSGKAYDILILWQVMPPISKLKNIIKFNHCAFFPMYDNTKTLNSQLWSEYSDCNIINFSKAFHNTCKNAGLSSYYIQYFPKPIEVFDMGEENSIFFWQRSEKITTKTLEKLISTKNINKLYLHKSPDPKNKFIKPSKQWKDKVIYSSWFNTKQEMQEYIQKSALYIAPRKYEGIGMSFLEAMAAGRCVIAPNYPTMNEYIINGETGYLYDLKKPKKINLNNIRKIQKNTLEYIKRGHNNWEQDKYKILEYIESKPNIDNNKINEYIYLKNIKTKILGFIPLKIKQTQNYTKYEILNFIPLRFNNPKTQNS